ncbi:MAG TPA: hypothetical protein VFW79_05160 [Cellulomonas sp.]|uniref:hypothetical protein n=1 Tax=Cellulomonas sp. TaxID=40001 RepID=UPI002E37D276|nr:hypothetical protein [Cellulomonas sp.]HEX5332013.1 hypothetical protein [Cellulomonas sp.]
MPGEAPGHGTRQRFGLPNPQQLIGIALRYQIAQNATPTCANQRPRDLVDLLLIRDLIAEVLAHDHWA